MTTRPYAVFSCDLDTVDRHLQGYGFEDMAACDRIYRTAVPRLLELFHELGVPGVLFVIARDAASERALWRQAVQASGTEVVGFRAPAWDVTERVLQMVAASGYRYDASIFPTPVLVASRLAAYRRSTPKGSIFSMDLFGHAFAPAVPHRPSATRDGLIEFPISVRGWLRLPVYHTFSYFVPKWLFARGLRSGRPLCYEFHAADLLDLASDGIDPRMDRHPGMKVSLAEKRASLRDILAEIARERRVVTYRQAMEEGIAA